MTQLFKNNLQLAKINHHSLKNPRLTIVNQDAWKFLEFSDQLFDVIIIDLPDPSNLNLSRLYSKTFYTLLQQHLSFAGIMVTQASSPLYSRNAFWSIFKTIKVSGNHKSWQVKPYHTYIPSFGEWGFILATRVKAELQVSDQYKNTQVELKYLTSELLSSMQHFPIDMEYVDVDINSIHDHKLLNYYLKGWAKWFN